MFGMEHDKPLSKSGDSLHPLMAQLAIEEDKKEETGAPQLLGVGKEILENLEKIDAVVHPMNQKILSEAKKHPEVIAAVLTNIVGQQEAQQVTEIIEKGVEIAEKIETAVHNTIVEKVKAHETEKHST